MVTDAEKWEIEFRTCNHILAAIGMVEYQLTQQEEEPIERTIEILTKRQSWIDEADSS